MSERITVIVDVDDVDELEVGDLANFYKGPQSEYSGADGNWGKVRDIERGSWRAEVERLRGAAKSAMNELGVPGDLYPAPVANAHRILREALDPDGTVGGPT